MSDTLSQMRLHPKPPVKPMSAAPPAPGLEVKQAFETSQYSGPLNPGRIPYASGAPPFSQPPVKTAGPPSEGTPKKAAFKLPAINRKAALEALVDEGLPGLGAAVGAGAAAYNDKSPVSGAALGAAAGALPILLKHGGEKKRNRMLKAFKAEGLPALGGTVGAVTAAAFGKSPLAGGSLGAGLGALPELLSHKKAAALDPNEAINGALGGVIGGLNGLRREEPLGGAVGGAVGGGLGAIGGLRAGGALADKLVKSRLFQGLESKHPIAPLVAQVALTAGGAIGGGRLGGALGGRLGGGEKVANMTSPQSQLAQSKAVGQPKVTAPPGPSIQQIAKPKGFGIAAPGATKTASLDKVALLERLVRLGATPIPKTPKLLMKVRSPQELKSLQGAVEQGWNSRVTEPLMKRLKPVVDKLPEGRVRSAAGALAHSVAEDPIGMGGSTFIPVPGAQLAYAGAKKGLEKGIDKLFPLPK